MVSVPAIHENDTYSGPIMEVRAASTAGGGTALTTGAGLIHLYNGIDAISLMGRNYSTAVVIKFALNPFLIILKTTDSLATVANLNDYSLNAQDNDSATVVTLSSLPTFASGGFLMVGSHLPFRGVAVEVTASNSTANVITVKYWNGSAWVSISATDGTINAATSLAVSGAVTWTVPTAWVKARLVETTTPAPALNISPRVQSESYYWTRWEWSIAPDASTTLASMLAYNRSTVYGELVSGQPFEEKVYKGPGGIGCVEALTDAGTANLIVNTIARPGGVGIGL